MKTKPVQVNRNNWKTARPEAAAQLVRYMQKEHRTAAQVCEEMGVSFMIARKRMCALERDWIFSRKPVRQGERGPTATAYQIVRARKQPRR